MLVGGGSGGRLRRNPPTDRTTAHRAGKRPGGSMHGALRRAVFTRPSATRNLCDERMAARTGAVAGRARRHPYSSRAATSAARARKASAPLAEPSYRAMGFALIGASLMAMFSGITVPKKWSFRNAFSPGRRSIVS